VKIAPQKNGHFSSSSSSSREREREKRETTGKKV